LQSEQTGKACRPNVELVTQEGQTADSCATHRGTLARPRVLSSQERDEQSKEDQGLDID
jgi:hypothetical protein